MRKSNWLQLALFLCLLMTLCLSGIKLGARAEGANGLVWGRDLAKAEQAAQQSKKWVLLDVYTNWCSWCKKLDSDVYTNPKVITFLGKSFVLVKVNGEDGGLGKYVEKQYGIKSYPTIAVLAPNGAMKGKINGYLAADNFLRELANIVSQ